MSLIVVRVYPAGGNAIDGGDFSTYPNGLTINAFHVATTAGDDQVGTGGTGDADIEPLAGSLVTQYAAVDHG
jgi:hypothetical protein